jgi:predicted nucleic acid-binding protein
LEVVIDSNCLISALIKKQKSRELICSFGLRLVAPEELIFETVNHKREIIKKAGISGDDFDSLINVLLSNIHVVPDTEFKKFRFRAKKLVSHQEDAPFIALALSKRISLWSDDKALKKQSIVKVYSTKDLIQLLD